MPKFMIPNGHLDKIIHSRNKPALRHRVTYYRPDSDVNPIISKIEIEIYANEFTISVFIKDELKHLQISDVFSVIFDPKLSDRLFFYRSFDTVNPDEVSTFFQYLDAEIESLGNIELPKDQAEINPLGNDVLSDILNNLSLHIPHLKIYPDPYDPNTRILFDKLPMVKSGNLLRNDSTVESIWCSTESYQRPYGYQNPIISEIHIFNINNSLKILVQFEALEFLKKLNNAFPAEVDEEIGRYTLIRQIENIDKNEVSQLIQYLDEEIDPIGKNVIDSIFNGMLSRYTELQGLGFNNGLHFSNNHITNNTITDVSDEKQKNQKKYP